MISVILDLAKEKFSHLSEGESALLRAVEDGSEAHPLDTKEVWVIRSSIIEWICNTESLKSRIHRHGLAARGFTISGLLGLINSDFSFPLQFRNCLFTDDIWLKGSRLRSLILRGCSVKGLNADSSTIELNVLLSDGFNSQGEVAFREATVGNSFMAQGSKFTNDLGQSLVCDRMRVSGGVFLSQGGARSSFRGEVRFSGADIGGNFDCEGASFETLNQIALQADRIRTGGSVFLRGCKSSGAISIGQSQIGVMLDCRGSFFASDGGRTLNAEKATIGSHVLLDLGFHCDSVTFLAASIEGGLRCRGARIGNLDLRHSRIDGPFEWTEIVEPQKSHLDLRDADLKSVTDDKQSWPKAGAIQFDGLRFVRFSDSIKDVDSRLEWLALDTSTPHQAYRQLSSIYEQDGRDADANAVMYTFEALVRSRETGVVNAIVNWLLWATIGYGYKLWRAAAIMIALCFIGFLVGLLGFRTKLIAPSDKDANAIFVITGTTPEYYPRFSASMYSVEHSLPALNLGVSSNWSANTAAHWPTHPVVEQGIRFWFWTQLILCWVLSVFFLAGLTGVVKKAK